MKKKEIVKITFNDNNSYAIDVANIMQDKGKVEAKRLFIEAGAVLDKYGNIDWYNKETQDVVHRMQNCEMVGVGPDQDEKNKWCVLCFLYYLSETHGGIKGVKGGKEYGK